MAFDLERAARYLQDCVPPFLDDLRMLVDIDSGTFDKDGVNRVVGRLADMYGELGFAIERRPDGDYGDTLIARSSASPPRLLLLGHTDTVYPAGTSAARPPRTDGERLYGPGAADMKAGDLAIVYALRALREQDIVPPVVIVQNSDEEVGSPASSGIIRDLAGRAEAALVLEPGRENGDIVSARKGIAAVKLRVHGVAAHAGVNHDRGRSAILELSHIIVALEALNGRIRGVTLNVGQIQGGQRPNVVPDEATAALEIRAFDPRKLDEAIERVRRIVATRTVLDTDVGLDIEIEHAPMPKSTGTEKLVSLAQSIADRLGFSVHDVATGGASDGNTAASVGTPVLDGLGPVGGGAHSPAEYVLIPSIPQRTALLAGLVAELTGH